MITTLGSLILTEGKTLIDLKCYTIFCYLVQQIVTDCQPIAYLSDTIKKSNELLPFSRFETERD